MLRRLTLVALALSLLFAQAAGAQPGPGKADPPGNAWGYGKGYSDGR